MRSSGTHLWLILWKAHDALREHADRHIHSLGLCFSDFTVLEVLLHKGPQPVNTIGARVRLTSGSITTAVDRLEARGFVERRPDPGDGRTRVVHLTSAGSGLIDAAFADHQAAMECATSGLTANERAEAAALLKKLGLRAAELNCSSEDSQPAAPSSAEHLNVRSGSRPVRDPSVSGRSRAH